LLTPAKEQSNKRYRDSLLAKGWKVVTVMLDPDDLAILQSLSDRHGGRWNAIRIALRQAIKEAAK